MNTTFPFVAVQHHGDPLRPLLQHQLGGGRGLSPERVPVAQADYPEALGGVQEHGALPLDGLSDHSDVPLFALAHLHGPGVLSRCEAGGSEHTQAAGAALRVVGEQLPPAVLHTGQLLRQL